MANSGGTSSAKKQKREEADKDSKGNLLGQMARRRVWRACESCRRKKIKCDGTEPICGQCTQTSSNCTWIQTRDRAALSRHYVQELENRLLRLESVLTQIAPNIDLTNLPDGPVTLSQLPLQPISPPSGAHLTTAQRTEPRPSLNPQSSSDSNKPAPSFINHSGAGGSSIPVKPSASSRNDSDEFVAEQMGTLALDDHGHLRWIGGSSTMSLIEAFRTFSADIDRERDSAPSPPDSTSTQNATPNPPSANLLYFPSSLRFGKVRALPGADEVEYPPGDLADLLVDAYFEKFHHTLPVLDSGHFRSKYRRLMDTRAAAEESKTSPEPPTKSEAGFLSVVFAVFAVASRFVDDDRLKMDGDDKEDTGGVGMMYYERALILYYIGATATQLAHVQAFVLLASYLASLNCLPQSWLLCGQAVRIAQDLGLHRSPKHLVMSPPNKETRRKVWWCVYGMDRMLAVALGRPLGIEDSDCDVELPYPIDDQDLPSFFNMYGASPAGSSASGEQNQIPAHNSSTLMAGFISLTKLHTIFGKILRTVYAVNAVETCKENVALTQANVERLDKELTAWCEKLPVVFKSEPKSPQEVSLGAILCSSYYSALIALHRNFLPTKRRGIPNPNWSSVPKAVFASRSCILLSVTTKEAIASSHHLAFFVQALFSAAVIILLCARFATVESAARTASEEVNTALVCLARLENSWPGAKKCKELLEELVEVTKGDMRVQVPGVGRIGSIDGKVDPTPPGVESVQTVYSSFKRAAGEGEAAKPEGGIHMTGLDPATGQPSARKIKSRPKDRRSIGGRNEWRSAEEFPSPRSGDSSVEYSGEMDYQLLDHSPQRATSSSDLFRVSTRSPTGSQSLNASSVIPSLDMSLTTPDVSSQSSPVMDLSTSSYSFNGATRNGPAGSMPHDWLPSPTVDAFGRMHGFGTTGEGGVFGNMSALSAESRQEQPPQGASENSSPNQQVYHSYYEAQPGSSGAFENTTAGPFDLNSTDIPFSGFDFLQSFGNTGANGFGGNSAFGGGVGGDITTWQNFVGGGVFSDIPDQPFTSLVEGGVPNGRVDE